ncbi:hypothetical protein [Spirosoma luteum]|uniref:hypothetical protein n=1 Tax=Spirosoma luteum TaxID=431553 RepID=UPI00037E3BD7|nr:hypothetical protein [Spirosoma luteum]
MEKHRKQTEKPRRTVIEVIEVEEITFDEFERTMKKVVRSENGKAETLKDKRKNR